MTPDFIFILINILATLSWAALAIFPRMRWVTNVLVAILVPVLMGSIYWVIIIAKFWTSEGSMTSLGGVHQIFQNPWLLVAAWTHMVMLDLLVGVWEVRDAQKHGIPHLMLLPFLILTFWFAPIGFVAYRALRVVRDLRPGAYEVAGGI